MSIDPNRIRGLLLPWSAVKLFSPTANECKLKLRCAQRRCSMSILWFSKWMQTMTFFNWISHWIDDCIVTSAAAALLLLFSTTVVEKSIIILSFIGSGCALFEFISRPLCNSNQFEIHRPLELPSARVQNVECDSIWTMAQEKTNGCNVIWNYGSLVNGRPRFLFSSESKSKRNKIYFRGKHHLLCYRWPCLLK